MCAEATDTGCVVAYDSWPAEAPPDFPLSDDPDLVRPCVDPAELAHGDDRLTAGYFGRTVPGIDTLFEVIPDYYTATCTEGAEGGSYLAIDDAPAPGDTRRLTHIDPAVESGDSLHVLEWRTGGFVDISQHARKAVFCGTFTAKGLRAEVGDGRLRIVREGTVRKLVSRVEEITYSGPFALSEQREAVYVTERAVFRLTPAGVTLVEVADGVSIERDILPNMGFVPVIRDVRPMPATVFRPVTRAGEG